MAAVAAGGEGAADAALPLARTDLFATTKAAFRSMIKSCESTMCVLVLDDHSTRVISSSMRMYDIMDQGVALVERLALKRQKLPEMEALYLIEPTKESVAKLVSWGWRERLVVFTTETAEETTLARLCP